MRSLLFSCAVLLLTTATAPASSLEVGFAGTLIGCETWILEPASWVDGTGPFQNRVGLGSTMAEVAVVTDWSLPPPEMRRGNHFWRINSTLAAGYVLVVSDRLPICHITDGGNADLRPAISAVLASADFGKRWEKVSSSKRRGLVSTQYRNREERQFTFLISQPDDKHWKIDRLQVVVTAQFDTAH